MGNGQTKELTFEQRNEWERANNRIRELTEENSRLRRTSAAVEKKNDDLSRSNSAYHSQTKNYVTSINNLREQNRLLSQENDSLKAHKSSLQVQVRNLSDRDCIAETTRYKRLYEEQIAIVEHHQQSYETEISEIEEEMAKERELMRNLEIRCENQKTQLNQLNNAHRNLIKSNGELDCAHRQLIKSKSDLEVTHQKLVNSKNELAKGQIDKCKRLEQSNTQLRKNLNEKATEINGLKNKVKQLENEKRQQNDLKEKLIVAKNRALEEKDILKEQFEDYKRKLDCVFENSSCGDMISVEAVGAVYNLYKEKNDLLKASAEIILTLKSDEESKTKEERFECTICLESKLMTDRLIFNPCGHGCCSGCATKLSNCHLCRTPIQNKIKQFA